MTLQNLSRICGLLANENRLSILFKISQEGEISNEELQKQFEGVSLNTTLKPLRDANLVLTRKVGRSATYFVNRESADFPIVESILEEANATRNASKKKLLATVNS